jgi:hypothetical protein
MKALRYVRDRSTHLDENFQIENIFLISRLESTRVVYDVVFALTSQSCVDVVHTVLSLACRDLGFGQWNFYRE